MKKYFLTAAALLLLFPFTATADIVATGQMTMDAEIYSQLANFGSGDKRYAVDYEADISSVSLKPGYEAISFDNMNDAEVFCVENAVMYTEGYNSWYDFNTSDYLLTNAGQVTWIAQQFFDGSTSKEIAQVAIWKTLIPSVVYGSTTLYPGYSDAADDLIALYDGSVEFIDDYLVAVNPISTAPSGATNYQNFLVKATATPVPEPGTMLLFGTGLAGLAAVSRRRRS